MAVRRILTLILTAFLFNETKQHDLRKRDAKSICDPGFNTTNKVQCYCVRDTRESHLIRSADCYLTTENVSLEDPSWALFGELKNIQKLTFSNNRGISLKYMPTETFKTMALLKLEIKYANIEKIQAFAFANLSTIEEITIRDSQVRVLEVNAFGHHRDLTTISLDKNNIEEINRDVFVILPSLETLFLTSNKITTIHDRAFINLSNLRELEINMNKLFSLNNETFSGLKKLQKLDLSSNNLEVIGDNTFLPLENLKYLNLDGNKIQMLDEGAFNGLSKLQLLSLAHNKLSIINNVKTFEGLDELTSLSLRANEIKELKTEVITPILNNFYDASSNLDVEDNHFSCTCHLDWFLSLMNRTQSKSLKIAMENLKCVPDPKVRESWNKMVESDRNGGQVFEEENAPGTTDYEYYDDTQLNGKLFYIDVRELLHCSNTLYRSVQIKPEVTQANTRKPTTAMHPLTNPTSTSVRSLELSVYETTTKIADFSKNKNEISSMDKKAHSYTTSRLATVSANPIRSKNVYDDMASDEAKPDKLKARKSIEEYNDAPSMNINSASRNLARVFPMLIICVRLIY